MTKGSHVNRSSSHQASWLTRRYRHAGGRGSRSRGATLPEYAVVLAALALVIVPAAKWIQNRSGEKYTDHETTLANADLGVPTPTNPPTTTGGTTIPPATTTSSTTTTSTTSSTLAPDTTPPPPPSVAGSSTQNNRVTLTFSDSEAGVTFECQFDGGAWSACTSPFTYGPGNTYDGSHTYGVRAKDAAGNVSVVTTVTVVA